MTFTFDEIVSFLGLLFTGLVTLSGVVAWLLKQDRDSSEALTIAFTKETEELKIEFTKKIDGAMNRADRSYERADAAHIALSTYQLVVAEKYATAASMKEVEERLVAAINNLTKVMNDMPTRISEILNAGKTSQPRNRSRT